MACAPRTEGKPGDNQFNKMIPSRAEFVEPMRREMQIPTNRTWDRLRFIVIIKTGKIAPAGIAAQLDQAGTNHDAKTKPAEEPDHEQRWPAFRKRPTIEQRTKKDREEPGFEQLRLPTIAVPNLPDVDDGHVHRPENGEQNHVGITGEHYERETEPKPGKDRQTLIGYPEPKERG